MTFKCKYCGNEFTKLYNLNQHQTRAKYCLEIQKTQVRKFECESCGKVLSRSDALKRHQDSCAKYQETQKGLEQKIEHLTSLIENNIKPATTAENDKTAENNRNIMLNNLQPVKEADIKSLAIDYLTIQDIKKGILGIVSFMLTYPLEERLLCVDKSRKKIQYKDAEGNIVNDLGAFKLSQTFFHAINDHNQELIKQEYEKLTAKVQDIVQRGAAHDEDVTKIMMEAMELQTFGAKCAELAEGGDNDLRADFARYLARKL